MLPHRMNAPPSRPTLRKLLSAVLVTEADFEAFCIDYFPRVRERFSLGMDRLSRTNLLLELTEPAALVQQLHAYAPQAMRHHAALLRHGGQQEVQLDELAAIAKDKTCLLELEREGVLRKTTTAEARRLTGAARLFAIHPGDHGIADGDVFVQSGAPHAARDDLGS